MFCFAFLASMYRKKCKACQHNHFNSKKCKRCGDVLDIHSPGRPRETTASEGYGVSVVHVTCSYGYEWGNSKYQATGVSSGQEAPKNCITMC